MTKPAIKATGLSQQEAEARLKAEGYNELPADHGRSLFAIIISVFREPMFGMLLAAGAVYFFIGDWHEAALLMLFASFSVTIAVVQEARSERVLQALRDMTSPRALVLRDGVQKRIPGREVARGDLVFLTEGDRVPADGTLVSGQDVTADESLLTGESIPVTKKETTGTDIQSGLAGGDNTPFLFSGTLMVRGHGQMVVTATGARSEIGKIGHALHSIETEAPRLQKETGKIVRVFGLICFVCSMLAFLGYGLLHGSWVKAGLSGIALGMALLPEEFPLVLTVFMVMGAWRISKARVLTRRASAIEMLGSATVLCTDKTGTLTENRMSIAALQAQDGDDKKLLNIAQLASKADTFDPMDLAVLRHAGEQGVAAPEGALIKQYGLQPDLLAITHVWQKPDGMRIVAAKGAPEAIAGLCGLDAQALKAMLGDVEKYAKDGIRVLAVAEAQMDAATLLPETPRDFAFRFVGLVGFADPLRSNVPAAVKECHAAGIRVVMITGDYPATAGAIAAKAGIDVQEIITGVQLKEMDDATLQEKCRTATVFARIMPEQKLRIVNAMKAIGAVVAMTGDGVNDAPALKAAHIGIAMGGRGTDVAREASGIVLLDDDFGSIVQTIRLGRRIYDNLQKAMTYIIAVHVPIAGLALLPVFFGFPLILTPLLIALMEMVIDPACSIVLEAEREESNVMNRPPRNPEAALLPASLITWGAVQGALALMMVLGVFVYAQQQLLPEGESRSLVFICLMACNMALIFINRSYSASVARIFSKPNPALWIGLPTISTLFVLIFLIPAVRQIFGFTLVSPEHFLIALTPVLALVLVLEKLKPFWRKHDDKKRVTSLQQAV